MFEMRWLLRAVVVFALMAVQRADGAVIEIEQVRIGRENVTKVGVPTVVTTRVTADEPFVGEVWFTTPDPLGSAVTVKVPLEVAAKSQATIEQLLTFGRLQTSLLIEVREKRGDGAIVARKRLQLDESPESEPDVRLTKINHPYWLVVGSLPVHARSGDATESSNLNRRKSAAELLADVHQSRCATAAEFPAQFDELRNIDTIILSGELKLTSGQSTVLEQWVQNGGHLIAAIGARSSDLENSPLEKWFTARGRTITQQSLGDVDGLKSFAATEAPITISSPVKGCVFGAHDMQVLVSSLKGPIVVRFAHGFGQVTLLGLEFTTRPLAQWRGLDAFLVAIARVPQPSISNLGGSGRIARTGFTDIASQWHHSVSQLGTTSEYSVLSLLGLVLAYLVIVGPLDFLFVHRVLKKPSLTWVSFPLVVVASVLLATLTARANFGGAALLMKHVELVDIDSSANFARANSWTTAYSSDNCRHQVAVETSEGSLPWEASGLKLLTSWASTPESNFGGMYRSGGLEIGKPGYELLPHLNGMLNLPIATHSTQTIRTEAIGTLTKPVMQSRLKRGGVGSFDEESFIEHSLPVALDQWLLAYGGRIYFHSVSAAGLDAPTTIEPGRRWSPRDRTVSSRELRTFMTGTSYRLYTRTHGGGGEESLHTQAKYDPTNLESFDVLRMLSFHEAAGATSYTGLSNSALARFDLTDAQTLDRAVLIGRMTLPVYELRIDGQPQQTVSRDTFVRILIPVDDSNPDRAVLPKFIK